MPDARSRGVPPPADDDAGVVDAELDPTLVQIQHQQQTADNDAEFAKSEAGFAAREHDHASRLRAEGRWQEADFYDRDAIQRMHDADRVMGESISEEAAVNRLREEKKRDLALELQRMPNQSLATLRTAVADVRLYVQDMTPSDKLKVALATGLNEERIEEIRERATRAGYAVEQALAAEGGARANARQVVADLVTFTAAVMTLADHLPALMELVSRFGQLLQQFHL